MRQIRFLPLAEERCLGETWLLVGVVVASTRWTEGREAYFEPRYIYDHEGD